VKLPFSLVVVSTDVPREELMSATVAPGITAPDVSRTDPNTDPLVTCASAVVGAIHIMTTKVQKRRTLRRELAPMIKPPAAGEPRRLGFD
jgi:hypothetical protein